MAELTSCECQFIRCLKPNERKAKETFFGSLARLQIKYMGVLDSLKVRKDSFPIRRFYKNFYLNYHDLHPIYSKKSHKYWEEKKPDWRAMSQQ